MTAAEDGLALTFAVDGGATDAAVAEVNRRLVEGGVSVYAIEPERVSLEARFLEMTTRLEQTT